MAPKEIITIYQYTCTRCQHVWRARNTARDPRVCGKCKSPYWDKPLKRPSYLTNPDEVCSPHKIRFCASCSSFIQ